MKFYDLSKLIMPKKMISFLVGRSEVPEFGPKSCYPDPRPPRDRDKCQNIQCLRGKNSYMPIFSRFIAVLKKFEQFFQKNAKTF